MPTALAILFYGAVSMLWLLGALRAMYLYFGWLRKQKWYWGVPIVLFAILGPLLLLIRIEVLDNSQSLPATILIVLFGIGGICMATFLFPVYCWHGTGVDSQWHWFAALVKTQPLSQTPVPRSFVRTSKFGSAADGGVGDGRILRLFGELLAS